ncbi:MAG: LysR family transcriptional regulator [Rhodococcus sp. (in: high G+C Gram-positive bacteria)]|nr:MAG: LysR family transcriptional regulator [Rhodococcus sp. (in: high G+C Gram-positive bacteria)]
MELRVLRYFLTIVETGSVTKAAEEVRVAQPSLSRQLRGLEASLGMTLFDRGGRQLILTAAGRRFLPLARDLVARADAAEAAVGALASGRAMRITVAAPPTTITDVIAPFLATWGPEDPLVTVQAESPARAYQALGRGADVAISTAPPRRRLAGLPVARLPLWAYVRADHAWANRDGVTIGELAAAPLIVLTPAHGTRRVLDHAVQDADASYDIVLECDTPHVALALLRRAVRASGHRPRMSWTYTWRAA